MALHGYCGSYSYEDSGIFHDNLFIGTPKEIEKLYDDLSNYYIPYYSDDPKFNYNKKLYGLILEETPDTPSSCSFYHVISYENARGMLECMHENIQDPSEVLEFYDVFHCELNSETWIIEEKEQITDLLTERNQIEEEAGYIEPVKETEKYVDADAFLDEIENTSMPENTLDEREMEIEI